MKISATPLSPRLTPARTAAVHEALTRFVQQEVGRQRRAVAIQGQRLPPGHPDLALRGWANPDAVAERIVQTTIASIGTREPSQVAAARDAIRRGFTYAERILSGLPSVAVETRKLVEQKFEKLFMANY